MSMEAQFYEALRRQHIIERRQSLGVARQVQQPKYQSRYIPVGVLRQDDMQVPWPYNPLRRTKLATSDQNLYKPSSQDSRSRPTTNNRPPMHGKLRHRFSVNFFIESIDLIHPSL